MPEGERQGSYKAETTKRLLFEAAEAKRREAEAAAAAEAEAEKNANASKVWK